MSFTNKLKQFNDPIYGFIAIPNELIFDLIEHKYFQRLRRISQMGLSYLVYPGAHHTRFHHALGAMHLMQKAIEILKFKKVSISEDEENALLIAILLHDIGHGPFSHALEQTIIEGMHHETLSLLFMEQLNLEFKGKLSLAIQIFKGEYPRKFMLQLVSSQLDMDRMDYLKRDSFYSGVAEGNINSDRLIQMLNVVNDTLVLEEKAIYSIEKFLMARRLMYWQTYLHKTSLVAELMLTAILKRAREVYLKVDKNNNCSESLSYFLLKDNNETNLTTEILEKFSKLDDYDIICALKNWQNSNDFILRTLSEKLLNRQLFKIKLSSEKFLKETQDRIKTKVMSSFSVSQSEMGYLFYKGKIKNKMYNIDAEPIRIMKKDKSIEDIVELSDQLNPKTFSREVVKYYICYPKEIEELLS